MITQPSFKRVIRTLDKSAFRSFLGWQGDDDGHVNAVFVAQLQVGDKDVAEVYGKFYPMNGGADRGLVNEITGFLVGQALGISQPKRAFVAEIPLPHLPRPPKKWLVDLKKQRATFPAFCTERLDGKSAAWRLPPTEIPSLISEVAEWDQLPKAIAIDENIAHTDRHLNNLIKLGSKRFAVIDNGILATSGGEHHWVSKNLNPFGEFSNRLAEIVYNGSPKGNSLSAILGCSQSHETAITNFLPEMEDWWERLLVGHDHDAFKKFIIERTKNIEGILRKRFGALV